MPTHKSEDYKLSAVEYYLTADKSQEEVCKIFKCSARSLMRWVDKYNENGEIKRHTRKPVEEPTAAETRRIIDLYFRSTFTTDKCSIDKNNNVYLANDLYKTENFQKQHKYALFKILADVYYEYATKYDGLLQIPLTVSNRTSLYLELSCNIVQWFKNSYEQTTDIVYSKLKDVFLEFNQSDYYINLSKNDKRKYNKTFFINYFETNIYLKKYYTMTKKLKLHTVYIMYK